MLVAAALVLALLDRESGIPAWRSLRADQQQAADRVRALEREVDRAEREAAALVDDPFALEAAIREDLGLARPGETVVRMPEGTGPGGAAH